MMLPPNTKTLQMFATINRTMDLPLSVIVLIRAMGRVPVMVHVVQQRDW